MDIKSPQQAFGRALVKRNGTVKGNVTIFTRRDDVRNKFPSTAAAAGFLYADLVVCHIELISGFRCLW